MQWLVRDAQPKDSLFFHCERCLLTFRTPELTGRPTDSGHGGQTKDLDGDEADGFDEVIYPVDFKQAGHIVDDVSSVANVSSSRLIVVTDDARHYGQAAASWVSSYRHL